MRCESSMAYVTSITPHNMEQGGWVVIDKDVGSTSMHNTHTIKKLFNMHKAGHAGTLDPLASGILPIALGTCTSFIPFAMEYAKTYTFTVRWGAETTTDDCLGVITETTLCRPGLTCIERILPQFTGEITQIPPAYSAAKVNGVRAYKRARCGEKLLLSPRTIHIHSLKLMAHDMDYATFEVVCGTGTYVRSLARDMAKKMGCLGHIEMLRRTSVGPFSTGYSLDFLQKISHKERMNYIKKPDCIVDTWPICVLKESEVRMLWDGKKLATDHAHGTRVRCYDGHNRCIAIARADNGLLSSIRCFIGVS